MHCKRLHCPSDMSEWCTSLLHGIPCPCDHNKCLDGNKACKLTDLTPNRRDYNNTTASTLQIYNILIRHNTPASQDGAYICKLSRVCTDSAATGTTCTTHVLNQNPRPPAKSKGPGGLRAASGMPHVHITSYLPVTAASSALGPVLSLMGQSDTSAHLRL